jgi:hypothetical protein
MMTETKQAEDVSRQGLRIGTFVADEIEVLMNNKPLHFEVMHGLLVRWVKWENNRMV